MYHIVEENGDVCISILHEPGEDKWGYEKPEERWLPIHTVETILISVISMLADPNDESPANVDAAVSNPYLVTYTVSKFCVCELPEVFSEFFTLFLFSLGCRLLRYIYVMLYS